MNLNMDRNSLLKFLIMVVLIAVVLLVLIIYKQIETAGNINSLLEQNISETNWPQEVPVIKKNNTKIVKHVGSGDSSKVSWTIVMKDGVSYTDFRDYLLELEEVGFKPVKSLGSKSPRLLVTNPIIEEDFYIFWYGDFKEYRIEVYWANLMGYEPEELGPLDYSFTVTLSKGVYKTEADISGDTNLLESGDLSDSGDVLDQNLGSGDNLDVSGDTISGDVVSGDIISSGELAE